MATSNMIKFMQKNQDSLVVFGERLTPEGNPAITGEDNKRSDRMLYRFDDGEELILLREDSASKPEFTPNWDVR